MTEAHGQDPDGQDPEGQNPQGEDPHVALALAAELGKKTGVSWLGYDGQQRPAWHVWVDDALHVVSGGAEQPLPGLADAEQVAVTMRSKENGGRLLTWVAAASALTPEDERWQVVTSALAAGRLNVPDLASAPDRWAAESRVTRLEPTGELLESPDRLSAEAHLAEPTATPATTRGRLPRVLHRRVTRRPKLS